jgi:hypothetical protein
MRYRKEFNDGIYSSGRHCQCLAPLVVGGIIFGAQLLNGLIQGYGAAKQADANYKAGREANATNERLTRETNTMKKDMWQKEFNMASREEVVGNLNNILSKDTQLQDRLRGIWGGRNAYGTR